MESSPRNDRLAYLSAAEVADVLDAAAALAVPLEEAGFTGGEPFLNRDLIAMLDSVLERGLRAVVLTNGMKPMQRRQALLLRLRDRHGPALTMRVSLDHYDPQRHEQIRGEGTWAPAWTGLRWLVAQGFRVHVASRTCWHESDAAMRAGFARLFAAEGIPIAAEDPVALTLFPEMDPSADVPEITTRCWSILGLAPQSVMCASSRMVIKRKGADRPTVVPCTLLPYEGRFDLGPDLGRALGDVKLNHPFCAQFCVLGGASCSARR